MTYLHKLTCTSVALLGLLTQPAGLLAQNLVPNASFEQIEQQTRGHAHLDNVAEWFNTNQHQPASLFGTPDHMYINTAKPLKGIQANIAPHTGQSALGLITYMQRVPNYREFASVKLKNPLQTGKTYRFTFHVNNGNEVAYGSIAANGLGVAFSQSPLEQYRYEPIGVKPQFYLKDILYTKEWKSVSFEFTAEAPYEYLTMGNFLTDEQLSIKHINYDIDPQTYVYIDDLTLTLSDKQATEEATVPVVAKQSTPPATAELVENRHIHNQSVVRIPSKAKKVTLKVWDDKTVDGDVLSLLCNDHWLAQELSLKRKKKKIQFNLVKGGDNRIILFAHDLGKEPPITAAIEIKCGGRKYIRHIRSDLGMCGAIKLAQ